MGSRHLTLYLDGGTSLSIELAADEDPHDVLRMLDRAHNAKEKVTLRVVDRRAGGMSLCTVDGARLTSGLTV